MGKFSKKSGRLEPFGERNVGVLLAGGPGKRLDPLTKTINKHLLPVGNYPMIYHPLIDMINMGIKDIILVTGHEHIGGFTEHLGDGSRFGVSLMYVVQEDPNGIGGALGLVVERLVRLFYVASLAGSNLTLSKSRLIVMLGDNIFNHNELATKARHAFMKNNSVDIFIKKVNKNNRYGVPCFNSHNELLRIEEKPDVPPTDYAVTGLYAFKMNVVMGLMKDFMFSGNYKKSDRGEYEIADLLTWLAMKAETMQWLRVMCNKLGSTYWTDAGTHLSLHKANNRMCGYKFWSEMGD